MKKAGTTDNDDPEAIEAEEAARARAARAHLLSWLGLVVVLAIAAAFRLTGISWGLPNQNHLFSYHPDETVILFHSLPIFGPLNLFSNELFKYVLPHFYNYGSLQLYLINIVSSVASGYNAVGAVYGADGNLNYEPIARYYLLGRCLTAAMGLATVWVVWLTARRLWGAAAAFWAALLLAVMPLHVQHSHFMTVDVPATFWIALSLYWSVRVLRDEAVFVKPALAKGSVVDSEDKATRAFTGTLKPWLLAGVFAGFAAATKYNAALVILPLLVAGHFRRGDDMKGAVKGTLLGLVAFVIAFIIACPGAIFDSAQFLHDLRYEGNHVYRHGEPAFQHTGSGWLYIITHNLDPGMGTALLVVALIAVGIAVWRRRPEDWLLLSFALPYYLLVGAAQSRYARYEIPLLPVFALWVGMMVTAIASYLRKCGVVDIRGDADGEEVCSNPRDFGIFLHAPTVAALLLVVWTAHLSAALIAPMARTDPRDMAVNRFVDRSLTFGFATVPWFYTPPLNRLFCLPGPGQWISMRHRWEYQHLIIDPDDKPFDAAYLRVTKPDVVFLSEFEYAAPLRLHDADAMGFVAELRGDYNPPIVIGQPTAGVGLRYIDGLPVQALPHDMLYTNPQTLMFVRKVSERSRAGAVRPQKGQDKNHGNFRASHRL